MHSPVNIYKNLIVILVRNTQNYISILQSLFIYIYIHISSNDHLKVKVLQYNINIKPDVTSINKQKLI